MGTGHSTRRMSFDASGKVNFDHFQILRAIGKGSFGKVCIVQKKDTKRMFAMKYMNKAMCARQQAINNVIRELNMLTCLDHPFLVNLWYAFQDEEDMFMVVDLLLGGDLRFHMNQEVVFTEECIQLYIAELALALDYLRSQNILHRDIKPDNILLDEQGHCHVTDFNIATQLSENEYATSISGTWPYMAPETFGVAINERRGYSYPVDWWSLGISIFEILKRRRPFSISHNTSASEVWAMMTAARGQPLDLHRVSDALKDLLMMLLEFEPKDRLCSLEKLKEHKFMSSLNFDAVLNLGYPASFVPSKEHLNCDPTYELEEMIIETKPLHKKKKRLAKQISRQSTEGEKDETEMDELTKMFKYYNKEEANASRDPSLVIPSTDTLWRGEGTTSPTTVRDPMDISQEGRSTISRLTSRCKKHRRNSCTECGSNWNYNYSQHHCLQEGPTVTIPPHAVSITLQGVGVTRDDVLVDSHTVTQHSGLSQSCVLGTSSSPSQPGSGKASQVPQPCGAVKSPAVSTASWPSPDTTASKSSSKGWSVSGQLQRQQRLPSEEDKCSGHGNGIASELALRTDT
ncbi:serine/threonine-protein kinase 32A-like isoform X2 [Littorina saxatilis]